MASTGLGTALGSSDTTGSAGDATDGTTGGESTGEAPPACGEGDEPPGSLLWEDLVDGPVDGIDGAADVAVDGAGNVYVVGWVDTGPGFNDDDIWIRKYDPAGTELWTQTFDGITVQFSERGDTVAVAPDGGVVLAGDDRDGTGPDGDNVRLIRLSADGQVQWETIYAGTAGLSDYATDLAIDEDGTIYVAGGADETDAWLAAYDASGTLLQAQVLDTGAGERERFSGVAIMPDGGPVVVGTAVLDVGGDDDAWIRRLDPNLEVVWEVFVDGPAGALDSAASVAVTPDGDVIVGGSLRAGMFGDAWIARYDDTGQEVWSVIRDGSANNLDFVTAVATAASGNIVVGGLERIEPDNTPVPFLLQLDGAGAEIWSYTNGVDVLPDSRRIESLAVGAAGCIAVAGSDVVVTNESYRAWTRVHAP